jgi:hypothetical protein
VNSSWRQDSDVQARDRQSGGSSREMIFNSCLPRPPPYPIPTSSRELGLSDFGSNTSQTRTWKTDWVVRISNVVALANNNTKARALNIVPLILVSAPVKASLLFCWSQAKSISEVNSNSDSMPYFRRPWIDIVPVSLSHTYNAFVSVVASPTWYSLPQVDQIVR